MVYDEQNFLRCCVGFSATGYAVETASNAEDALKLMDKRSFELALVVLEWDRWVWMGLCFWKSSKRRLPASDVVMMTAYPTVGTIKQSHDKGASAFLTKPVDLQHLMRTIEGLV